ncbi:ATP-dependent helicase HrpB [Pseudochrobactrum asaccharolyticum]|uniref:ATP-dependent helicase HrpB n=1 Tax=Pseudochrobactrum asaccharolyticum TaxID=354351 RepID=A0A366E5I8_9HYPH|nr:ATP-dependent helicase HrpB [Pseudochrobactrum asaccharolyticum]RBO97587.1 ATP-dependent helicase HrpB [Pseudochrobactrum asaccharolyticum]
MPQQSVSSLPLLPVREALPQLDHALQAGGSAVLVAPPGAGKTTLVPLHLLQADWRKDGRIIVLEPRRLAARAAATQMARLLGEEVGKTVGYRMRLDSRYNAQTQILVVTEGVFARMILDDPELSGISAVLFDEFHERSLDADFGLALALDVQGALRPDLKILVMSATLDGARVAELLDNAPVVESEGRSFPVEIRYQERKTDERIEDTMARTIRAVLADEQGSLLCFLPGQGEIERTVRALEGRIGDHVMLCPLYGVMDGRDQDAAIKPAPEGKRKVVLATSIAETSITIDGVRVVIDSGLSRQPRFEPATGLTRLETVRASQAAITQRAGRAGRTQSGIAIRLWHEGQTSSLPRFTTPEILEADLSSLLLDCAAWGVQNVSDLRLLDQPSAASLKEAATLLKRLGALDNDGRLTVSGEQIRKLALPVRLAHMVAEAANRGEALQAAELAVLMTERGLGGNEVDLDARLSRFRRDRGDRAQKARGLARSLIKDLPAANAQSKEGAHAGRLLLDAYPDRVAKARGNGGQFILANGRGGELDASQHLSRASWLVVADLTGRAGAQRILSAAEVSEEDIRKSLASQIEGGQQVIYDPERKTLRAREAVRLGAITLSEKNLAAPSGEAADLGVVQAVRQYGLYILPWDKSALTLRRRLGWLYRGLGEPWPSMDDEHLLATLEDWLLPFLTGEARLDKISQSALMNGLRSLVPFDLQRQIDTLAPTHFTVPTGSNIAINYEGDEPVIAVRVQELFGLTAHPSIARDTVPLLLELLSPAHRPIQITRDLPNFWKGSWADVRTDMRGRYPRHVWPENPAEADPTRRAKPRGT